MGDLQKLYVVFTLLECPQCKWPQGYQGHFENDPPSNELLNQRTLKFRCHHCALTLGEAPEETQAGAQAIRTIVVEWNLETHSRLGISRM